MSAHTHRWVRHEATFQGYGNPPLHPDTPGPGKARIPRKALLNPKPVFVPVCRDCKEVGHGWA
jgi:hypothetical protein